MRAYSYRCLFLFLCGFAFCGWAHGQNSTSSTQRLDRAAAAREEKLSGECERAYLLRHMEGIALTCEEGAIAGGIGASYVFGRLFLDGEGGLKPNAGDALVWISHAAEAGDVRAQVTLGDMYLEGKGVQADLQKAVEWYLKAFHQGDESAKAKLEVIQGMLADKLKSSSEENDDSWVVDEPAGVRFKAEDPSSWSEVDVSDDVPGVSFEENGYELTFSYWADSSEAADLADRALETPSLRECSPSQSACQVLSSTPVEFAGEGATRVEIQAPEGRHITVIVTSETQHMLVIKGRGTADLTDIENRTKFFEPGA